MVATRLGREFGDQVLRLEATHRGRLSGLFTDLRTILAIQTDRKSVDRLGEYILRRPVRVASLLAEHPDPVLLTALAGDRAMRNLSGLDATGTDGENVPHASTLESLAARAARDHLRLCQTDPTVARQREATWAANRAAVRSSFLRESVDAMESTFGSACHVILDRAEGRRPLVVPPGEWQAQGVMAAVAAELPRAYRQMCEGVPMQASMPARWAPRGGDRHRGWDRARVRFIAKGGIGRAEQLARRSLLRVGVSTVAMRYRLATALDAGPAATQQFLQRAASNPRRAAALLRMNMDPMVVASALGPKAMEAVMSGRPVPGETNLHRLCDALVRADRARVEELRRSDNPQAELLAHRRDQDFGAAAGAYVNRQWHGAADRDSPLGSDVLGLSDNPEAFYQLWQQRRTGDPAARELPAAIQNRMQEVRNGPEEAGPDTWAPVFDDFQPLPDTSAPQPGDPGPGPHDENRFRIPPGADDPSREFSERYGEASNRFEARQLVSSYIAHVDPVAADDSDEFSRRYGVAVTEFVTAQRGLQEPEGRTRLVGTFVAYQASLQAYVQAQGVGAPPDALAQAAEACLNAQQDFRSATSDLHVSPAVGGPVLVQRMVAAEPGDREALANQFVDVLGYEGPLGASPHADLLKGFVSDVAQLDDPQRVQERTELFVSLVSNERMTADVLHLPCTAQEEVRCLALYADARERLDEQVRSLMEGRSVPDADRDPVGPGMSDPIADRPAPHSDSAHEPATEHTRTVDGQVHVALPAQVMSISGHPAELSVYPGQEDKFALQDVGPDGSHRYSVVDDPEVDQVTVRPDGSYDVRFYGDVVPTHEVAAWAAAQAQARIDGRFVDAPDVSPDQAEPVPDRPSPDVPDPVVGDVPDSPEPSYRDVSADDLRSPVDPVAGSPPPDPGSTFDVPADDLSAPPFGDPPSGAAEEKPVVVADPDRFWDDGTPGEQPSGAPARPQAQGPGVYVDVPAAALSAPPPPPKHDKYGRLPDRPPVPDGPEIVEGRNGRWDVVDDPLVSHLTELPDGGYRVHFHPGVEPAEAVAKNFASTTHRQLLDQTAADRDAGRHEHRVATQLGDTLSRQLAEGRAPCDEDRRLPGGVDAVVVGLIHADKGSPESRVHDVGGYNEQAHPATDSQPARLVLPLHTVSFEAARAWMRDQDPEVYTPEFATQAQIEAAGGKLRSDAEGVEVVRYYERNVQPYGQDGKVDFQAKPVQIAATELVTVYHVDSQLDPSTRSVREQFKSPEVRQPQPLPVEPLAVAKAVGAEVVDDQYRRSGYHFDDNVVNTSPVAPDAHDHERSHTNGQLLYAAARKVVETQPAGIPESPASMAHAPKALQALMASMAAERVASKLAVAYTPVTVPPQIRSRFAQIMSDPAQAERVANGADAAVQRILEASMPRRDRDSGRGPEAPSRPGPSQGREESRAPAPPR